MTELRLSTGVLQRVVRCMPVSIPLTGRERA
jgi:hypothetical protein